MVEIGDGGALREAIAGALGGETLIIEASDTLFSMKLQIPGLLRPLQAREFSRVRLCLIDGETQVEKSPKYS